MFPAIRDAFRGLLAGDAEPISLCLKGYQQPDNFGFDTTVNLEQQKLNRLRSILGGGGPSWSGEQVTDATAMNLSVVWACRRIISESVALMPCQLMREVSGSKEPQIKHPLYTAVHDEPNSDMSDMEWRETQTDQVVSGGNSFSYIVRRGTPDKTAIGFEPIQPGCVRADRNKSKQLVYIVKEGNEQESTYTVVPGKPQDLLHVRGLGGNGIWGYSVIGMARQSLGAAISADKYASRFYASGGRVPYVLERTLPFKNDEMGKQFREDWNRFYGNSDNWHQAPIMEPGMTYKQIGLSPEDAQFIETRQYNIPEICRWFLISPNMVGELSRTLASNAEHLAEQFVKFTLAAWIRRWEKALRRCALTPEEKGKGYYFKHNMDGLLRGDFQTRMAGYATALQNGYLNIDEVRDLEDRNALPDGSGQAYHIQLNQATVPGTGEPMAAEKGILAKGSGGTSNGN